MFILLTAIEIEDENDRRKFTYLYEKYNKYIFRVCIEILKDPTYAEEAYQDTYEVIATKIKDIKLEPKSMLKSYLVKIAKSKARNTWKKHKHHIEALKNPPYSDNVDYFSCDSESEPDEIVDPLVEKLLSLPELTRDILTLHHLHRLKVSEVAELLGMKIDTVKSQLKRAKKALEKVVDASKKGNETNDNR